MPGCKKQGAQTPEREEQGRGDGSSLPLSAVLQELKVKIMIY